MKRSVFLTIAAVLAFIFGLSMLFAPDKMLENMATVNTTDMQHVLQWAGSMLTTIGLITFLARNDPGSPALRALMSGQLFLHVIGFIIDVMHYNIGFVNAVGLISG